MAYHRGQKSKLRFDIVLSVFFLTLRLDIQVFIRYESFSYSILSFLQLNFKLNIKSLNYKVEMRKLVC